MTELIQPSSNSSSNTPSNKSTLTFLSNRTQTADRLGLKTSGLPLRFRNLSVYSSQSDLTLIIDLPRAFTTIFTTPVYALIDLSNRILSCKSTVTKPKKITILSHLNGLLHHSELLLILGRSGSGVTSTLRALSSTKSKFSMIEGQLDYGSLSPTALYQLGLQSEVVMVEQTDDHFPTLTLDRTLSLASKCNTPSIRPNHISRQDWSKLEILAWIKSFGLSSTSLSTPVGSAHVHGLSGGERRRVSVIEGIQTEPSILCLDNPTAGLDSSTALQMIKCLKDWARIGKRCAVVGLRQGSDNLYQHFDRLLLLYDGHSIFFGPTSEAITYFQDLGFERLPSSTSTDFLCSITDPDTRRIREGFDIKKIPKNPKEFVKAYEKSKYFIQLKNEMIEYESLYPSSGPAHHVLSSNRNKKDSWMLSSNSPWTVNYFRQLIYLIQRQYALIQADLKPYTTKTIVNILLSLIIGSVFYDLPQTTEGAFTRGSILFLSILFNGYLQLAELAHTLAGRPIVQRHKRFGFYSPAILALARTIGDLPLIGFQVTLFGSITYLMAGLQADWSHFLVYLLIVYTTAINLTAVFRLFGSLSPSFDEAMRYCGLTLNIFVVYAGYFIPFPAMRPGLHWIKTYIDPISYAFEAVLANEFRGLKLVCSELHTIPRGPSYTNKAYQTCTVPGAVAGSLVVDGEAYVRASYGFEANRLVPNLIAILGLAVVALFGCIWCAEKLSFVKLGAVKVFRDCRSTREKLKKVEEDQEEEEERDQEFLVEIERPRTVGIGWGEPEDLARFDPAVVTFKDLSYSVQTPLGQIDLLQSITGYIQPGQCTALMGASGAGKTTLLNVIAGRLGDGRMGAVTVDGRTPSSETYKSIGFVEQLDTHDEKATVREALTFAALLRQPRAVPLWAKLADVERVMELLGLTDLAEAMVGTPPAGLGLEDRKRLSIAIELVARPRVLLVDEPVSGLEGRQAMHIISLLSALARETGLGVMVTVHQPSGEMFECFDRLMLLERGGRLVYFGPRSLAVEWFEGRMGGRKCKADANPAEYLIESVRGGKEGEEEDVDEQHQSGLTRGKPDSMGSIIVTDPRGRQSVVVRESNALRWIQSREAAEVAVKVEELSHTIYSATELVRGLEPFEEILELTRRCSRHFWRDSVFSFTQLFTALVVGGLIGFSFGSNEESLSMAGLKSRLFSVFLILFVPPVIMNQLIMKSFGLEAVYKAKEGRAGVYKKISLTIGLLLAELPYSIGVGFVFWMVWFWGVGYPVTLETVVFTFLAVQLFFLFQVTWAIWIAGLAPTIGVVANLLPFFLVSMEAFNGSLIPYGQMPWYWRWMYWLSPFQWYVRAVLSVVLHRQPVKCAPQEWIQISPPPSLSCEAYMSEFVGRGTLQLDSCRYCPVSIGDDFVDELLSQNDAYEGAYRSLAIFSLYVLVNLGLVWVFGRERREWRWKWRRGGKISL